MKKFVQRDYHALTVDETLEHLDSSVRGLSEFGAEGRLKNFGSNEIPKDKKTSPIILFFRQFHSPLIYIIMAAATVSVFIGHFMDAGFIMAVVLINTVVGFLQENKAENALEALRNSMTPHATVLRGGTKRVIPAEDLVVGDVMVLSAGDYISADGRILSVQDLYTSEAVLTGEWVDIKKLTDVVENEASLGDRTNMLFAGSHVSQGEGMAVVTATGTDTELGKIARLVRDQDETMDPLKKKFADLSRLVGFVVMGLIVVFAVLGLMQGQTVEEVFITSTALVVSAIPEGLLPAVTIVMIFGVRRLVKKRALVRHLSSTETIGAITVICTDKTGTITEGEMRVSHILTGASQLLEHTIPHEDGEDITVAEGHAKALFIGGIVNDAYIENTVDDLGKNVLRGRPTDRALLSAAMQVDIDRQSFLRRHTQIARIPFSSERKFAMHAYENNETGEKMLLALGAPEKIFERVRGIDAGGGVIADMESQAMNELRKSFDALTHKGLRVLACAEVRLDEKESLENYREGDNDIKDLVLVGFIALKDPVRDDAQQAIEDAKIAGIRPMIITGDHARTVEAITEELNWHVPDDEVCVGKEMDELSDAELRVRVMKTSIFARVAPEHKIRIVRALQDNGEIVAMVGDGVNDAPALKAAHVGISMGNGTDITKGVADIVLLNSSFATIIKAVEQGRVIYENIRRIIIYLVADNFSALFVFFVAMLFGMPLPLAATQILWINLVEDSFPNIALTTEKDSYGLMNRPPRSPHEPILTSIHKKFMAAIFFVSGLAAVGVFAGVLYFNGSVELAQTMTFTMIAFDSLALAYVLRSFNRGILRKDIFSNTAINYAVGIAFVLLLVGMYTPLSTLLKTVPITLEHWLIIIGVTVVEIIFLEMCKKKLFATR